METQKQMPRQTEPILPRRTGDGCILAAAPQQQAKRQDRACCQCCSCRPDWTHSPLIVFEYNPLYKIITVHKFRDCLIFFKK